jgi:poly(A) polymerase
VDLFDIPSGLLSTVQEAAKASGAKRLALVGGAVRDALLRHVHRDPWRALPDVDLVVEGCSEALVTHLRTSLGLGRISELRIHKSFGTAEFVLDGVLVDLAQARRERYPSPGQNPQVEPGSLEEDLARRDFTINAMALVLYPNYGEPELLDLHGGQQHLATRQLNFLHAESVHDDPTRVIRGARYAARLNFSLAPQALEQLQSTVASWPWVWSPDDALDGVPPALGSRLRMELELLFCEPWRQALSHLQAWGAMPLLDPQLQTDVLLCRRLHRAKRLQVPLLCALVAASAAPQRLARRLQLPLQQQRWIEERVDFQAWMLTEVLPYSWQEWSAARWTSLLETRAWSADVVVLDVALLGPCWRPLLRWWGRWRHVASPVTARELLAQGMQPGPAVGHALREARLRFLEGLR